MDKFTMRIKAFSLSLAALVTLILGGCVGEDEPNEIGVSQQVLLFEPEADFTYVTLTANSPWKAWVEIDNGAAAAWCRLGTTAGGASQQVQVIVEANDSAEARSARIFFENTTSKRMRTSILVSQSGVKDNFGD